MFPNRFLVMVYLLFQMFFYTLKLKPLLESAAKETRKEKITLYSNKKRRKEPASFVPSMQSDLQLPYSSLVVLHHFIYLFPYTSYLVILLKAARGTKKDAKEEIKELVKQHARQ